MADVHKPKSYDRVQASLVESDKNTPGCLHTLNCRGIYKRNAQQERLFMLQQRGVVAGSPGCGAHATIPTPVADDAKRSTAASLPIQDIGVPATEPTAYPNPSPHHRNTLAPSAIRHTRELDVATVIQQPQNNGHSGPTEPGFIDYMRVPHHKKTAGGTLAARASRTRTESYAVNPAVAQTWTAPTSHQAAQTLDRRSLDGVQEPLLTVPRPSTNGRPASVTAATSRARPAVIREKTIRPHHDFGNHLYKDARTRRRLAEPENSHPLVGVDERMYRSEMREYAVYGGVPAIAPPPSAHSTLDHPPSSPYAVDYPVSAEVTQEYARGPSSTGYQVVASPTDSHGHPQMVSAPADVQDDAFYDLMPLFGDSVGSTSAENDVSYELSRLNAEYFQTVEEGKIALMIQNILQEVQEVTAPAGDMGTSSFTSQHQMSYLQHSLDAPEVYPYSARSLPLAPPPAHFSGESAPFQLPFPTPPTASFDASEDAYDQHRYAPKDAQGSSPRYTLPSSAVQSHDHMAYPMSLQAKTSRYPEIATPQSWDMHSGVVKEYPNVSPLSLASTDNASSFESEYDDGFTREPGPFPTEDLSSYVFSSESSDQTFHASRKAPNQIQHYP